MITGTRYLVAVALVAGTAAVRAQGLDLKTGTWRWTMTMTGEGMASSVVPPDVKARAAVPQKYEDCVSPEDLKRLRFGVDDDDGCKISGLKVTPRTADYTRTCTGEQPRTEFVHMESASSGDLKVTVRRSSPQGPALAIMTGSWLNATCKDGDR
jgi:hypothetical protein